jgi:predicted SprT family Zn-dependent metalloprotease
MDLNEAKKMANELIQKHCPNYNFEFSKTKSIFGDCYTLTQTIRISEYLTGLNDEGAVRDTILHEIAHALTPGQKHNKVWKRKAREIGCNGKSGYDSSQIQKPKGNYVYECPNCKKEFQMYRIKRRMSACRECCVTHNNGKYSEKYKLTLKEVRIHR